MCFSRHTQFPHDNVAYRKALHILCLYQGIDVVFERRSFVEFEMSIDARPSNQSSIHSSSRHRLEIGDDNYLCCPSTCSPSQVKSDFGLSNFDKSFHSFGEDILIRNVIVGREVRLEDTGGYRLAAKESRGDRVIEMDVVKALCTGK